MNMSTYTNFQDIKVGDSFIDSDGFKYRKVNTTQARCYDVRFINGYIDYQFDSEWFFRVQ